MHRVIIDIDNEWQSGVIESLRYIVLNTGIPSDKIHMKVEKLPDPWPPMKFGDIFTFANERYVFINYYHEKTRANVVSEKQLFALTTGSSGVCSESMDVTISENMTFNTR